MTAAAAIPVATVMGRVPRARSPPAGHAIPPATRPVRPTARALPQAPPRGRRAAPTRWCGDRGSCRTPRDARRRRPASHAWRRVRPRGRRPRAHRRDASSGTSTGRCARQQRGEALPRAEQQRLDAAGAQAQRRGNLLVRGAFRVRQPQQLLVAIAQLRQRATDVGPIPGGMHRIGSARQRCAGGFVDRHRHRAEPATAVPHQVGRDAVQRVALVLPGSRTCPACAGTGSTSPAGGRRRRARHASVDTGTPRARATCGRTAGGTRLRAARTCRRWWTR